MPSTRLSRTSLVASAFALLVGVAYAVEPATAQTLPGTPRTPVLGPVLAFVVALVLNLVLGALVVGIGPRYSRELVARIRSRPVESFVYGLVTGVAVLVAIIVLTITVIGLVVVIPGVFVLAVVGVVANVLAVVTLGAVLAGASGGTDLWKSLAVGAVVVSAVAVVPVVGDVTNFVLGTVGLGAVASRYWENRER